jgi:hypothetical protein
MIEVREAGAIVLLLVNGLREILVKMTPFQGAISIEHKVIEKWPSEIIKGLNAAVLPKVLSRPTI